MNKQIVIASLFGTALAAAPDAACTNMVVKAFQDTLSNTGKTGLKDVTAGLKDVAKKALEKEVAEKPANDKAIKTYDDYKKSIQQVIDDWTTANKNKLDNDGVISDMGKKVSNSATLIDGTDAGTPGKDGLTGVAKRAKAAWKKVNDKIDAQLKINAQIAAAIVLHTEEQKILEAPLITAKASTEAKRVLAKVTAFEYKNSKLIVGGESGVASGTKSGTTKVYNAAKAATAAITTTTEAAAVDSATGDAVVSDYFTERIDFDKASAIVATWTDGCKGKASPAADTCKKLTNTLADDATKVGLEGKIDKQTAAGSGDTSGYVAKKALFDTAITALEKKLAEKEYATQWEAAVKQIDIDWIAKDGQEKVKDDNAKQAVVDDGKLELPKQTAVDNVKKYIVSFGKDAGRGEKALQALQKELVPLTEAKILADFALAKEQKLKDGYAASKAAASARQSQKDTIGPDIGTGDDPTNFATLQTEAKETYDRVKKKLDFYTSGKLVAAKAFKVWQDATKAADKAVLANTGAIKGAEASLAAAIAKCKTAEYLRAQDNKKKKDEKVKADDLEYNKIKPGYDEKIKSSQRAASATAGAEGAKLNVANTLCAYPAKKDGAQPPRPQCAEGLCCGAAQRFMKDGTKMAIETCQAKEAHQYTYYPPLPAGATVAPTAQTWRFQCISGAQKLVAAATAALAASYMMA